MVDVLSFDRARDHILVTCARNVWLLSAMYNISIVVSHVKGSQNTVADVLSRWRNPNINLHQLVQGLIWVNTYIDFTLLNHDIQHLFFSFVDSEA